MYLSTPLPGLQNTYFSTLASALPALQQQLVLGALFSLEREIRDARLPGSSDKISKESGHAGLGTSSLSQRYHKDALPAK